VGKKGRMGSSWVSKRSWNSFWIAREEPGEKQKGEEGLQGKASLWYRKKKSIGGGVKCSRSYSQEATWEENF